MANQPEVERLDVQNPDFPFLAARASAELDNLLLGRSVEPHATKALAQLLQRSIESVKGSVERRSLMDPATTSVFANAMTASGLQRPRTLSELAKEAWSIASDLESSGATSDRKHMERLRAFCTHLASSAVAQDRFQMEAHRSQEHWS